MTRFSRTMIDVQRRDGSRRRVIVERRDLSVAVPVVLESYVIVPRSAEARHGRLAREVAHMLRGRTNFPNELRSDR